MAFRFQRRIKIAPGIRLNVSKGGLGVSAGVRGASLSAGRRGLYSNVGVPGTGLSHRSKLSKNSGSTQKSRPGSGSTKGAGGILFKVDKEGNSSVLSADGHPLPNSRVAAARKQFGVEMRDVLQGECEKRNTELSELATFHYKTPKPSRQPHYEPEPYPVPPPSYGLLHQLLAFIWPPVKQKMVNSKADWEAAKGKFDQAELARQIRENQEVFSSIEAMQETLADYLGEIPWPQEPEVDFDLGEDNKTIALDLLLPPEDGIPDREWSAPSTQYRLSSKQISASKRRQIYRDYVHSIVFRVAGEIFARLPTVEHAMISAYRQVINPADGNEADEYILSTIVQRSRWEKMDFVRLRNIEPVEAFTNHNLRRKMTKTGVFRKIEPFTLEDLASAASSE